MTPVPGFPRVDNQVNSSGFDTSSTKDYREFWFLLVLYFVVNIHHICGNACSLPIQK